MHMDMKRWVARATRTALRGQSSPQALVRPRRIPLSFSQQRLWFLSELYGPNAVFNVPIGFRVTGTLNHEALRAALDDLGNRHESLRTLFEVENGVPQQKILKPGESPLCFICADVSEATLQEAVTRDATHCFDLTRERPLRAYLYRLAERTHVVLLVVHHSAIDAWSVNLLLEDLTIAYAARLEHRAPAFTALPFQYADYAIWQRAYLGDGVNPHSMLSRQLSFWRQALADLPTRLALPTDRPRPAEASSAGDSIHICLDDILCERLYAVAGELQVSLFMVLHAGVAALLNRLGCGDDIPLGSTVPGRNHDGLGSIVGFFVNTLVLRIDTSGSPSFRELVARVRGANLDAFSNQEVPFERVVEALNPARTANHHALFQVMVQLIGITRPASGFPGAEVVREPVQTGLTQFDLLFGFEERRVAGNTARSGLDLRLEYATALFDRKTAQRLVTRLLRLLQAASVDPGVQLGFIDVLSGEERVQWLVGCNATKHPVSDAPLPELFEARVATVPDSVALIFGTEAWSYAELNSRANRLAHRLILAGMGSESMVCVALPRSAEMVVGLLAILKCGACYLPLDLTYPEYRLQAIIEHAAPECLMTVSGLLTRFPGSRAVVLLDEPGSEDLSRGYPDTNPTDWLRTRPLSPLHAAYVLYTSGSTGSPKGVAMPAGALSNLLQWHCSNNTPGARVVQFTSIGFDVSIQEILSCLLSGGTLLVAHQDLRRDPAALVAWMSENGATELYAPTAVLEALAEAALGAPHPGLSVASITQAGEPLILSRAIRELCQTRERRLCNHYGPTETHVATSHELAGPAVDWPAAAPIGRPIWNVQVYVLDDELQPVPQGITGELYISGRCLARGYLYRPALTAERFVANPASASGERMYRTGDRVRWSSSGELEYVGRADRQIKLRGFRIELGEVESQLLREATVAQAVAVVREDRPGHRQLLAYVTAAKGCDLSAVELRNTLRNRLPEFMVPAFVMVLDAMPLNINGKLDHEALPAPDSGPASSAVVRTPEEGILANLFAEVLQRSRVAPDESFFDLGGHSLLAVRLANQVRAAFDIELPVKTIFEAPTVGALARRLRTAGQALPVFSPGERPAVIPLSHSQWRLWFLYCMEGPNPTYNIPIAFSVTGRLDVTTLRTALEDVVARHEILRTLYSQDNAVARQFVLEPEAAGVRLEHVTLDESELAPELRNAARYSFRLTHQIPLKAWLFQLAGERHVILLLVHHIAADGWSLGLLLRDLEHAFAARSRNKAPRWQALPTQYADYVLWQRRLIEHEGSGTSRIMAELDYWRVRLDALPTEIVLPTDRPRPRVPSYAGATFAFTLPPEVYSGLLRVGRDTQASLFMVIHAGFAALLMRLGAGEDIPIGSPIAGRTQTAFDEAIGSFVNTLVLRADISGNPTFADLVGRVRSEDLAAYAHANIPFEMLVEAMNPQRVPGRQPLFQVMLTFQTLAELDLRLPGLTSDLVPVDTGTCKADLNLNICAVSSSADTTAPRELLCYFEYATDLFDAPSIAKLAERLGRLLRGAVRDPRVPVGHIDILDTQEREQLLLNLGGVAGAVPRSTLPELFEEQAVRHAQRTAVTFEGIGLTYAEVNSRANHLAHRLIGEGVGPEDIVAVALPRSPELVVCLLAVLKSGAAYLPLDPDYPDERLAFLIEDATPVRILTSGAIAPRLPVGSVSIDVMAPACHAGTRDGNPDDFRRTARLTPEHPAYVIYTSGSTGKPKGVVVTHQNVVRLLHCTREWFEFTPQDVWMLFHSFAFDFSVWEIWGALCTGGRLVVVPYLVSRSPEEFLELIVRERVTVLNQTPSAFYQLIRADEERRCPGPGDQLLRVVILGGEALSLVALTSWYARHPPTMPLIVNMYGITETTVHVTYLPLSPSWLGKAVISPIGEAIPDLSLYVLDDFLQPVPVGVTGQLYVCGAGLARGYLNRSGLTAERFVACPFGPPGGRMYRTGDLVRRLGDLKLDFIRRADSQVKIRGYRIELQEIQACLQSCRGVAAAHVDVTDTSQESGRLVAWFVKDGEIEVTASDLVQDLQRKLPQFMIPASFIAVPQLPLTVNGKIDRAQLPLPSREDIAGNATCQAPRTWQEELMAAVWEEVLEATRIGMHDNFFSSGGDSIRAVQLVRSAARRGMTFSIKQLFQHQTIAKLAAIARYGAFADDPRESRLPSAEGRTVCSDAGLLVPDAYPLASMQRLMAVEYERSCTGGLGVYHVQQSIRMQEESPSLELMQRALDQVVSENPVLRTVFLVDREGQAFQAVKADLRIVIEEGDLSALSAPDQDVQLDSILFGDRRTPFVRDGRSPLLHFYWLRLAADTYEIIYSIHHAIDDGWGNQVFLAQLFDAYARAKSGSVAEPRCRPNVYREFIALEREVQSRPEAIAFWRDLPLSASPALISHAEDVGTTQIQRFDAVLDGRLLDQLRHSSRRLQVSLKSPLLSAYLRAIERQFGNPAPTVGLVINGRTEQLSDPFHALGLFWNLVPFGLPMAIPGAESHIRAVHELQLELEPHANYPLTDIIGNHSGRNLFFATFNFVDFHNAPRWQTSTVARPIRYRGHDRFHYPLNYLFAVDRADHVIAVRAEYESSWFSEAQVRALTETVFDELASCV